MNNLKHAIQLSLLSASSLLLINQSFASSIDSAISQGEQRAQKAQVAQVKIDAVDKQTKTTEAQYRAVVKEVEGLDVYVQQINKQLIAQESELKQIDDSIKQVTLIERQITPLMLRMIDAIDIFVEADVPFQQQERKNRVADLQQMMGRSDVTVAEKYRKVMDAYQKEMDYGRSIKTYRSTLDIDGTAREVDFLRIGRIALMYQSLDGENIGIWNKDSSQFETLDNQYKSKLTMALRIAREQAAPDLIKIPLFSPSAASVSIEQSSTTVAAQ